MDFGRHAAEFGRLGFSLAALSVDPPARSARLHQRLGLSFALLCDPSRETVKAWVLFNPHRGGIAVPATLVIAADGRIRLLAREAMAQRLRPGDLLHHLAANGGVVPTKHGFWPRAHDWWRALIH